MNRYYRRATRIYRIKLMVVGFVLCLGGLYLGVLTDYTCPAAVVLGLGLYVALCLLIELCAKPWCSIHPYFQKGLGLTHAEGRTFLNGMSLARNLDELDDRLADAGERTISSFGYKNSFHNDEHDWHRAQEGLRTFQTALALASNEPSLGEVVSEIEAVLAVLQVAEQKKVLFCLHMRIGDGISVQEIQVREGHYH